MIYRIILLVLTFAASTSHASLLGGLVRSTGVLDSKQSDTAIGEAVDSIDFAAVAADPAAHVAENLSVDTTGKGIKGLKKAAIAVFQVRFRRDLNNDNQVNGNTRDGIGLSASASMKAVLDDNPELYQKLTDQLYEKFATDLKASGIELVDIGTLAAQDGYKRGRASAKENGRIESLSSLAGVGLRDGKDKNDSKSRLFSKFTDATSGIEYYIHYAAKAPELIYPHGFSPDCTGFIGSADVRIVEPGPLSPGIVEAAEKAGVGLIIVGYEVRNLKYDKGGSAYSGDTFASVRAKIHATPMMRTQLLAVKMTKEGATSSTFYTGVPETLRASDGLQIIPATHRASGGGLINTAKVYRWIETTGPDMNTLLDISSESGDVNHLKPGAGYEAAFWQAMDAQRSLAVTAIKGKL